MSHTNLIYQARLVLVALLQGAPQGAIFYRWHQNMAMLWDQDTSPRWREPILSAYKTTPSTIMENAGVAGFPALQLLTQVFQDVSAGDSIRSAIACS